MVRSRPLVSAAFLSVCLFSEGSLYARGVTPYLPLNLDPEVEREVERVLILGDKPVMTRPIPAAMVLDALPRACAVDPVLCGRVRRALKKYMGDSALEFASVEGAFTNGARVVMPNQHGETTQSQYQVAFAGYVQPSDYVLLNLGGVAYDGRQTPTGTFLSFGADWAQVDAGWRDHWWSPFTDSAMMISTESPSMPGITISNYDPFTRLGIQYETFLERVSYHHDILLPLPEGGTTQGYPKYFGGRLAIAPANSGWSLGANRIMMFGGGAAGGQTASELLRAFFNPQQSLSSTSNGKAVLGKQMASITSRLIYPGRLPFSLYFEFAGNDTAAGNLGWSRSALSVGLQFPRIGPFDLTYEISEWQPTWYLKSPTTFQYGYGEGITNYMVGVGHWFADQRYFGDEVGGQSNMLRIGFEPKFGGRFETTLRMLVNESFGTQKVPYAHSYMGSLMYSYPLKDFVVGAQVDYGRDVFAAHYTRVSAFLRYGDALHGGAGDADEYAPATRPEGIEFHIDAGAVGSSVLSSVTSDTPRVSTGIGFGPHLSIGARRAASAHQDVGAAVELDDVHGASLFSARIIDYRYRFDNPLALNLFLGGARYAAATPAYGFYIGAGMQWRDILPRWDVGFDLRYASKVDRIRTLPSDPQSGYRPDAYFDITYGTLYVSRKF